MTGIVATASALSMAVLAGCASTGPSQGRTAIATGTISAPPVGYGVDDTRTQDGSSQSEVDASQHTDGVTQQDEDFGTPIDTSSARADVYSTVTLDDDWYPMITGEVRLEGYPARDMTLAVSLLDSTGGRISDARFTTDDDGRFEARLTDLGIPTADIASYRFFGDAVEDADAIPMPSIDDMIADKMAAAIAEADAEAPISPVFANEGEVPESGAEQPLGESVDGDVLYDWYAYDDYWAASAPSDGSLAKWADDYYISHSWSRYGEAIHALEVGDRLIVNGDEVVIEGYFDVPDLTYYDEVMDRVGQNKVVFQTCNPGETTHVVYGSKV